MILNLQEVFRPIFFYIAIIFLDTFSLDTKKKETMANGRISGPNVQLARFVFDNTWSVDRLEAYATAYYPDGIPLRTLRHGLGHHRVPLHQYAQTLVKFATLLFAVGHVRTPASLLVEIILFRNITPLTQAEVCVMPEKGKKGGGGIFSGS
jgi:hypothetical protein